MVEAGCVNQWRNEVSQKVASVAVVSRKRIESVMVGERNVALSAWGVCAKRRIIRVMASAYSMNCTDLFRPFGAWEEYSVIETQADASLGLGWIFIYRTALGRHPSTVLDCSPLGHRER
jgi:hypothetical protein